MSFTAERARARNYVGNLLLSANQTCAVRCESSDSLYLPGVELGPAPTKSAKLGDFLAEIFSLFGSAAQSADIFDTSHTDTKITLFHHMNVVSMYLSG